LALPLWKRSALGGTSNQRNSKAGADKAKLAARGREFQHLLQSLIDRVEVDPGCSFEPQSGAFRSP